MQVFTVQTLEALRSLLRRKGQHVRAVATGGMRTLATRRHQAQPTPLAWCPDCDAEVAPTLQHVLWHCPGYAARRHWSIEELDPWVARLGWSSDLLSTSDGRTDA
eukprot:8700582-Alexandrium_andersonii.AAC.1